MKIPDILAPCKALFEDDPVRYLDLIEPLRRGEGQVVAIRPTGALVRMVKDAPIFSLSAADPETAEELVTLLQAKPEIVFVHEAFSRDLVTQRLGGTASPAFHQAAYLKAEPLPLPDTGAVIRSLGEDALPFLLANYDHGDEAYLRRLLSRQALFGAFEGKTLMGFVGLHPEGTMGLLEVLPLYRRRGLGRLLESWLINHELSLGHIPYCQVFEGNAPSVALQQSLGLEFSQGQGWFITG